MINCWNCSLLSWKKRSMTLSGQVPAFRFECNQILQQLYSKVKVMVTCRFATSWSVSFNLLPIVLITQCHFRHLAGRIPLLCKHRPSNCVPMWPWSVIQVNFLFLEAQMVCCFVLICRPYCFLQGTNTNFFEQLPRISPVVSWRRIVGLRSQLGGEGCWKSNTWFHLPGQVCHTSVILVEELNRQAESLI